MNKSLAIVAALVAAATMLASSAQAGIKIRLGFGGPLPVFTAHGHGGGYSGRHYHRERYLSRRIVKKEKVYAARRKAEPKVAEVETKKTVMAKAVTKKPAVVAAAPAVEAEVIADNENSSITTAALDAAADPVAATADGTAPVQPTAAAATVQAPLSPPAKTASKLDCKKFFPSVGMTLTVPCE